MIRVMLSNRIYHSGMRDNYYVSRNFLDNHPISISSRKLLDNFLSIYAVGRQALMAEHRQSAAQLQQMILEELQTQQEQQLIRSDTDPAVEVNVLLTLVNGIGSTLIQSQPLSAEQQQAVLQDYGYGLQPVGLYVWRFVGTQH